jgi:putative polyketide hydroxylase
MKHERTQVLVVGGGTVGLASAVFLGSHGVPCHVVERHARPSVHPRALGMGVRTMELMRQVGLQDAVDAACVPMGGPGFKADARTLADLPPSPPPVRTPDRPGHPLADLSPAVPRGGCPQDRLDAVLLPAARERGATVAFGTELLGIDQDGDGVTATVTDADGTRTVRAEYLVGADGSASRTRTLLGIPTAGPGPLGTPMTNVLFRADLVGRFGVLPTITGITHEDAPGMLISIGDNRWTFHFAHAPDGPALTDERLTALVRTAIGVSDVPVEVLSALAWRPSGLVADRFREGRVFLVGDAAHTVPPLGAFGMNTGVSDAHNLAWKLAMVLDGRAGDGLLDTYQAERRPVAQTTLHQAMLRLADHGLHWNADYAAQRAAVGAFNAPVVHLGYRYDSTAVVGADPTLPSTEDVRLDLDGTPGSRLPHLPVLVDGVPSSTLDLVGPGFLLLAGPAGGQWCAAADEVAARTGLALRGRLVAGQGEVIDPGDVIDPQDRWCAQVGIGPAGALVVRPDGFVAWRAPRLCAEPAAVLGDVLRGITSTGAGVGSDVGAAVDASSVHS